MAAVAQPRALARPGERIPWAFWPLLVLTLLGIGLVIYRLVAGLGVTTNLKTTTRGDCGSRSIGS
jgi:hypothetical protein